MVREDVVEDEGDESEDEKEEETDSEDQEDNNEDSEDEEMSEDSSQIFDLKSTPPPPSQRSKLKLLSEEYLSSSISDEEHVHKKSRLDTEDAEEPNVPFASTESQGLDNTSAPDAHEGRELAEFVPASELLLKTSGLQHVNILIAKKTKKPMRDAGVQVEARLRTSMAVQTIIQVKDDEIQFDEEEVPETKESEVTLRKRTRESMRHTDDDETGAATEDIVDIVIPLLSLQTRPKKGLPWRTAARYTSVFALGAVAAVVGLATIPEVD